MSTGYIFVHVMAVVGTLTAWAAPFVGLMVYYGFAILRPTHLWFWNDWHFERFSYAVAISTLIGWGAKQFGDWSDFKHIRWPMLGLIIYMLAGIIATMFFAIYRPRALEFLELQLKIGLMALVTISLVRDPKQIKIFGWVIFASLAYLAYNFNMQYLDNPRYAYTLSQNGFAGIDNNGVAMVMVCGVPLGFFLAIQVKYWWAKGLCIFGMLCLIHVVLFSFSRGGQLGLLIVGAMIFVFAITRLPRKVMTLSAAAAAVAITLYLAGAEVREEFASIFVDQEQLDESASSRFDTWRGGWMCMLENPMGVGPRNFNLVSADYGLPDNKSVHNLFLQTGADYGFAGAIGLTLFYIATIVQTFRMARSDVARRLKWPRYYGAMVSISLIGFMVCSMFIGMESVEASYLIALIGLCTVQYVQRIAAEEKATQTDILPELVQVRRNDDPDLAAA